MDGEIDGTCSVIRLHGVLKACNFMNGRKISFICLSLLRDVSEGRNGSSCGLLRSALWQKGNNIKMGVKTFCYDVLWMSGIVTGSTDCS
jgi:hypothetical protein